MKVVIPAIASVLISLAIDATPRAADEPAKFKISAKKTDDKVDVQLEKNKAVFAVRSPSGISEVEIQRLDAAWPEVIVIRLHQRGLENFRVLNGKITLHASVSTTRPNGRVRVWKDDTENQPLDPKSPYWMEIRLLDGDGKRAKLVPLTKGYFEVHLPKAFFESNPKSITLDWIDFYRN